jgi:hypothetical protein
LSGFVIGDIFEVGAYPVASYPPTHCFELSDLGALLALVPDAEDILGIGEGGVQVVYHEPYVRTYGDEPPQDLLERRPQVSDCAFILGATALPGILRRTYRLIPGERSNYARGTRTDLYNESGVLRDDSGRFPDIRYTEWDCLTRFVQCAVSLAVAAAESGRTPQEE